MKIILSLTFITINIILYIVLPQSIFAAGVTLSPPRSILNTVAGETLKTSYTLTNTENVAKNFNITIKEISDSGSIISDSSKGNINWVVVEKNNILIESNKSEIINFSVKIPENTTQDTYKFLLVAEETTQGSEINDSTQAEAALRLAIGFPVEINVINDMSQKLLGTYIETTPILSVNNSFISKITVKNAGNISLYPITYVKVFNPAGIVVFQDVINTEQLVLSPNESKTYEYKYTVDNNNILQSTGEFRIEAISIDNLLRVIGKDHNKFIYIPLSVTIASIIITILIIVILNKFLRYIFRLRSKKQLHSSNWMLRPNRV